ncbi:MAG TPA: hypothetical protein DCG71_03790 [Brevundimonas sp.]|nr:hypothetical protein [Brevundimonas sp.]
MDGCGFFCGHGGLLRGVVGGTRTRAKSHHGGLRPCCGTSAHGPALRRRRSPQKEMERKTAACCGLLVLRGGGAPVSTIGPSFSPKVARLAASSNEPLPPLPMAAADTRAPQTVLVVDDLEAHRRVLQELLSEQADVVIADGGAEALEAARDLSPDLILMDMLMPDMDGLQVLQALKADPQTRDIPVIFLTALHQPESEAKALALGAVDYITKPVHSPVIMARVQAQLRMAAERRAMLELVFVDELTGIPNRRHFDEALRIECGKARRTGRPLSVGMVDVDCFKQFNDRYGHVAGDDALRADAEAYVRAFAQGLKIQAERGSADDVQMRLATDEGRAFMLLDAAVGDLS